MSRKKETAPKKESHSTRSALYKNYISQFYAQVPDEDQDLIQEKQKTEIAQTHWDLMEKRTLGESEITIYTPEDNALSDGSIIDIVSDNMSFIVDSIAAKLTEKNYVIDLLLHPVLHITRDNKGQITNVSRNSGHQSYGESHLHIHLNRIVPTPLQDELKDSLLEVLQDVRLATRDWFLMREKLREVQNTLSKAPTERTDFEVEEYLEFLEFLYKDTYTLLGYREYIFKEKDGKVISDAIKGTGLGILSDENRMVYVNEDRDRLTQRQQKKRLSLPPVSISKVNKKSLVHRNVPMDSVAVKLYDEKGEITGEALFVGLFTSVIYSQSIANLPYLRMKANRVLHLAGFDKGDHNYKALRHILEKYPRDELFQTGAKHLHKTCLGILRLQERQRVALFTRRDPFDRYISCLTYIPKERFDSNLRRKFQIILEQELKGECTNYSSSIDESPLARVIFTIKIDQKNAKDINEKNPEIEKRLQEAGNDWIEQLAVLLHKSIGSEDEAVTLLKRYEEVFPLSYQEHCAPYKAVFDIQKIETVRETSKIALDLYHTKTLKENQLQLKVFSPEKPMPLSEIMPILENSGLHVISEHPYMIKPKDSKAPIWIHDFLMELKKNGTPLKLEEVKDSFEEALSCIWDHRFENGGLNRLLLTTGMNWRDVTILRTYLKYLRQMRFSYSGTYMEQALTDNPKISELLVKLFKNQLDPELGEKGISLAAACSVAIDQALEDVSSLDQDRILRTIVSLVESTMRTNFFQKDEKGAPKPYLSIKLKSKDIAALPDPKPFMEIFVYSPRVEGVHLRGDMIARGGLRWSDRNDDFRTEVLGLMKAQMVKNAVIVPMGSKGGFVLKNPPKEGGREAFLEEGIACYKTFIRGLLDITDNRKGEKIHPPANVVRRDGDDPYLVVAADKGTATFSDIANSLAKEYDFWLGDAFASGGSAGYDHKKMGITARGAWESVKRHFRELGKDIQSDPFDVVGIGDMGGDVFGNGMLLSKQIRLVGAFNHLHIFCDPDPDPAKSWKERNRLFNAIKGWDAYNTDLLSKGGRIFNRSDKSLELTPEIRKRFGIDAKKVSPNDLICAMLKAKSDLLWFGGIGSYVKASDESDADVGDKANDALRINAKQVGAKVIGEGANLGITQKGRIEFAQNGGAVNADFIDNSGGVNSSDAEVNIKILLNDVMSVQKHAMTEKKRNTLLESMTDEIAALVLRNNYQQSQAISLMELKANTDLSLHASFINDLERENLLERELEFLPSEEEIERRMAIGDGLTRPELGILVAYAKITLTKDLLKSDIPDIPEMTDFLLSYFPTALRKKYKKEILRHRLKREIIATDIANNIVNRMGATFVKSVMEKTESSCADVVRAFLVVQEAFDLNTLWEKIEALDNVVPAQLQLVALNDIETLVEREITWFLTRLGRPINIVEDSEKFKEGVDSLKTVLDDIITEEIASHILQRKTIGTQQGLPEELSESISILPVLGASCDIIRIGMEQVTPLKDTAYIYFRLGAYFHLDWLRNQAANFPVEDLWGATAIESMIDRLYKSQAALTVRILQDMRHKIKDSKGDGASGAVELWTKTCATKAKPIEMLLDSMQRTSTVDLNMLVIAEQRLRDLLED